jgi:hypothetical protein
MEVAFLMTMSARPAKATAITIIKEIVNVICLRVFIRDSSNLDRSQL